MLLYLCLKKGKTVSSGSLTRGPHTEDETPELKDPPGANEMEVEQIEDLDRRKRGFSDFIDTVKGQFVKNPTTLITSYSPWGHKFNFVVTC